MSFFRVVTVRCFRDGGGHFHRQCRDCRRESIRVPAAHSERTSLVVFGAVTVRGPYRPGRFSRVCLSAIPNRHGKSDVRVERCPSFPACGYVQSKDRLPMSCRYVRVLLPSEGTPPASVPRLASVACMAATTTSVGQAGPTVASLMVSSGVCIDRVWLILGGRIVRGGKHRADDRCLCKLDTFQCRSQAFSTNFIKIIAGCWSRRCGRRIFHR